LGVTPTTVSEWRSGKRPVPIERCVDIERITGGVVTRQHLRPDDWHRIWPELVAA
jgi:DNA-binding transcriptional regulator YdaS (Cro superfamily)